MKKIFTILIVLFLANQINGKPPEAMLEQMKLPEPITRFIDGNNRKSRSDINRNKDIRFNPQLMLAKIADKSQKMALDSVIHINTNEPDEKLVFAYDGQGKVVSFNFFERDNGTWVKNSILLYTFFPNGFFESLEMHDINDETGNLEPMVRYVFAYDPKGNISQMDFYLHDEGEWALLFRDEFTYDSNNNLITEISYIDMVGSFMAWSKTDYTWENGNNTLVMHYNTDYIGGWNNAEKEEYTYNNAGQVTLAVISEWEDEQWLFDFREQYTYQNNKVTESIFQYWDTEENKWINQYRDLSQYQNNRLTLFTAMIWEENEWINDYKEEMTYDSHGNLTIEVDSDWEDGAWVPYSKEEYSYDTSHSPDDLIYPFLWFWGMVEDTGEGNLISMIKGTKYYEWIDGKWVIETESTFYWSKSTVTGTSEIPFVSSSMVFPNPSTDRVTISVDGGVKNLYVSMYDLTGRMVLDHMVQNNGDLFVGHLNKGIYMILVRDEKQLLMAPQKLIVR